jgi:hypothetical protein
MVSLELIKYTAKWKGVYTKIALKSQKIPPIKAKASVESHLLQAYLFTTDAEVLPIGTVRQNPPQ